MKQEQAGPKPASRRTSDLDRSIDEPTSVVSASECTGLLSAMPAGQEGGDALEDIVTTHPAVVPHIGDTPQPAPRAKR